MSTLKITITNGYLCNLVETFICPNVDMSDPEEVEYCIDECCGQYLDMHSDAIYAICPDVNSETLAEACEYLVEEVKSNEF